MGIVERVEEVLRSWDNAVFLYFLAAAVFSLALKLGCQSEYCEKKRNYQREYYHKKKKEKIERNKKLANSINNQKITGQNEEPKGVIIVLWL